MVGPQERGASGDPVKDKEGIQPRRYYPPGLYEEISRLRGEMSKFRSHQPEFTTLGEQVRAKEGEANAFLRGLAKDKSRPPSVNTRVQVKDTITYFMHPSMEVEGDTEFTQDEVDAIKSGRDAYKEITRRANLGSNIERKFGIACANHFPQLVQRDTDMDEVTLADRERAVWGIFFVAREAETVLLEPEDRFFTLHDSSREMLEELRDLPDKLLAYPQTS
jgi:hypothetical protein